MAFSDIKDDTATTIQLFVTVDVYDVDTETTTTLRWSEGEVTTNKVDGTIRDWEGRVDGWEIDHPDPPIGGGAWPHNNASLQVWIGSNAGDNADTIWDSLTDDHVWDKGAVTITLVDMTQDDGDGARDELIGEVSYFARRLQPNSFVQLECEGLLHQVRCPNPTVNPAGKNGCTFVQPVVNNSSGADLDGAVNDSTTTFSMSGVQGFEVGMVCLVHDSDELVRIENIVGNDLTVKRGYNGTTATAHADADWVYGMLPGANTVAQSSPIENLVLPFVFSRGSQDKGCHDVTAYGLGRSRSNYNDATAPGGGSAIEWYVGAGPSLSVVQTWSLLNDGTSIQDNTVSISTYNDWDNGATGVAGTKLVAGAAIGASNDYHLDPHPVPSGTYFQAIPFYHTFSPTLQWEAGKCRQWVLLQGLTDDGTPGGNPHRYPGGIMQAIIVNANWGLNLTLADYVYTDRITGWNTGDWQDEYSESWAEVIEGVVPAFGATEAPFVVDVFQELCDLVNADLFVREGLFYPTRRAVAGTADLTVEADHLAGGAWPVRVRDPQGIYCNQLIVDFGQDLLTEAHDADDLQPTKIPYTLTIDDYPEQTARGSVVSKRLTRQWFRMWLSNTYPIHDNSAHALDFLEHWDDSQQEQFDHRSQPQVWMESDLCESCAFLQQGETVDYNITGITTTKGQVRGIRKSRPASQDGIRQPMIVTVRSWHITF